MSLLSCGKTAFHRPEIVGTAVASFALIWHHHDDSQKKPNQNHAACDNFSRRLNRSNDDESLTSSMYATIPTNLEIVRNKHSMQSLPLATSASVDATSDDFKSMARNPSWIRRNLLAPIGIPLPLPRKVTRNDPALTLSRRHRQRRLKDETRMRQLLEQAPKVSNDPEAIRKLQQELCNVTFGEGVTAQAREDFLVRFGCTGWTDRVLDTIVDLCESRGIVEIGAGHGQWARALTDTYERRSNHIDGSTQGQLRRKEKKFDFCLAYDDMSNLPLNTHIYNPYTQPHHDYFGSVRKLDRHSLPRLLQSWSCRGRVLLLVYPPEGSMALDIVQYYINAAPENDTVIFVGEGRGGANGNDDLFDLFEGGDWVLLNVMDVKKPPGDKGYERLFILRRMESR